MHREKIIEKILLALGLILMFSSMPAGYTESFKYLTSYLFRFGGMFIIIAAFSSIMRREVFFSNTLKLFTYVYGGFISLLVLSIMVNQNLEVAVYPFERFILIFLFLGISLSLVDVLSEKIIINSLIISLGIVFIYFLTDSPISDSNGAYSGSFSNTGTFGEVAVTFAVISLVACTGQLKERRNYFLAALYLLITIGVSYLVIISNNRSASVLLLIILGIVSTTFTYEELKSRNLLTWKSLLIISLLALGGTSLFVFIDNPIYTTIESTIIDKFKRKIAGNGILDGRPTIWMTVIKDLNFFGQVSYFEDLKSPKGSKIWHSHNSFLQIMILKGLFAGFVYILFWVTMFIKSIQYYLTEKSTNAYAILPFVAITSFIFLSLTELLQFHVSTYLAISMVAIMSKRKEQSVSMDLSQSLGHK